MSVQAITWAIGFAAENSTEKAVLLVLANYADGTGFCFPGQESIAAQAACSERTVRRVLESLEKRGVISREERRRKDGSRSSDGLVLVAFRQPANLSGCSEPTGQSDQTNRPICPSSPDNLTGYYKDEPSEEPSGEPSGERAPPMADLAEQIWSLQPITGGKRKASRPDVRKALAAAIKRRGDPADILTALTAYYRLPDCRKDEGRFASGAAVMLHADRWRDFLPSQAVEPAHDGPVDPLVLARRFRRYADTGVWEPGWGPRPMDAAA